MWKSITFGNELFLATKTNKNRTERTNHPTNQPTNKETNKLTDTLEQSPFFGKLLLYLAYQETLRILLNPDSRYAFTRVRHLSLFRATSLVSLPDHPNPLRSILILSNLRLPLPSGLLPHQNSVRNTCQSVPTRGTDKYPETYGLQIYFLVNCHGLGPVAQSVKRLTTGCTVRHQIPVGTRFSARLDRPWGPPSLLYNEYRVFPGVKVRPGRAADHSPPSSAAVMEE